MILHSDRKGNDCIRKLRCHCIQILHSDIYSVLLATLLYIVFVRQFFCNNFLLDFSLWKLKCRQFYGNPIEIVSKTNINLFYADIYSQFSSCSNRETVSRLHHWRQHLKQKTLCNNQLFTREMINKIEI